MATNTKVFTLGLAKILFGEPAADGGMSTDLKTVGYTNQDSCNITQDDPEVTEFYAEEVDDPVITKSKKGKTSLTMSIMDPSVDVLKQFLGGTITEDGKWEDGELYENIELSVRIVSDQGYVFDAPRVKIDAKINAPLNNSNLVTLDINGIFLKPQNHAKLTMIPPDVWETMQTEETEESGEETNP